MKYAVAFFCFTASLTYLALTHGGWAWLLLWPALSFLIVGMAYAVLGSRVMGKDADGRIAWWSRVLLLPFRVFVLTSWWMQKSLSREAVCAEVAPGLFIGRRAGAADFPPGTKLVIDLTSEMADPPGVRAGGDWEYVCVPSLDASFPDESLLRPALDRIAATSVPVYIHCAQGHGRAGTFGALVLIRRGLARDVDEAVALMRQHRPGVHLNRRQRDLVIRLTQAS